jgi:hypothetical protein
VVYTSNYYYSNTEEYDGTSLDCWWKFKYSKNYLAGAGIQTAALAFGGLIPTSTGATELYDGTVLDNQHLLWQQLEEN